MSERITLQWFGDLSLNAVCSQNAAVRHLEAALAELERALPEADFRIANWESPLWGDGSVNLLKEPRLFTTAEAARSVLPLKLSAVSLANNHIYDCCSKGFENTVAFFAENNIRWHGAGYTSDQVEKAILFEKNRSRVAVLSFAAPDTEPCFPPDASIRLNLLGFDRARAHVSALAADGYIVCIQLHWGVEFSDMPTRQQRNDARSLIEAGASLVVGHHPHCVQGYETWKHGHIFYSLGNFVFSDVEGAHQWPEKALSGLVVTCTCSPDGEITVGTTHIRQYALEGNIRQNRRLLIPAITADQNAAKRFERVSRCLYGAEKLYDLRFAWNMYKWNLFGRLGRFFLESGGPAGVLRNIRWSHLKKLAKAGVGK